MTSQVQQPLQAPQIVSWCHPIGTRDGSLTKDAKMVNCSIEQTENGMALVKRPGSAMQLGITGKAQGGFVCNNYAYYIINDTIRSIDGTFVLAIPNVTGPNEQYFFLNDTPAGHTWLKSGTGLWQFSAASGVVGGTIAKVTDVNYPPATAGGIAYLNGIYYVMDTNGNVRGSALTDGTTWPPLNFIEADVSLGSGEGVWRHLNYLIAFYTKGIQFYYDANAANGQVTQGTQLGPVTNASWTSGLANNNTVVKFLDMTFFLTRSQERGVLVAQFNGLEMSVISTPYIEKVLSRSTLLGVNCFGIRIAGHSFYGLTLTDQNITLVYDLAANQWQTWSSVVNGIEQYFVGCNYLFGQNLDLMQSYVDGTVFKMDESLYTDAYGPINVTAVTPIYDYGTMNYKRVATLSYFGDVINTSMTVSHSDDDYNTWQNPRVVNLNTEKKQLQRGGRFRRRAFKMTHSDNTPLRLVDARFDLTVLNA